MQITRASIAFVGLTLAAACGSNPAELAPQEVGEGTMRLSMRSTLIDVPTLHVDVSQDGNTVASQELDVGNQPIPGDPNHVVGQGGDALFLLGTGKYDVSASPVASDGNVVASCTVAKKTGISVKAGQTTEIVLVIHCDSPANGLLDTVVVIEKAPVLETFTVAPNKFPCASADVSIQAAFNADFGGDVVVTAKVVDGPTDAQPALKVESTIITFNAAVPGDYTLAITGTAPLGTQTTQQITVHVQPVDAWNCQKS